MQEEPSAVKFFRSLFPKRLKPEGDQSDAVALGQAAHDELIGIINERRLAAPAIVHLFKTFEDRVRFPLDVAVLQEYAKKYRASAEVIEAISTLERGAFENKHLRRQLEREERERVRTAERAEAEHEVEMLKLGQSKDVLRGPLPRQVEEARLVAELEKLTGSPDESVFKKWERLVQFWNEDLKGMDRFKEEADRDIDARYDAMIAAIPPRAPNEGELRRKAGEVRELLRQRRDGLIADMARFLAEKLGADRRKAEEDERKK